MIRTYNIIGLHCASCVGVVRQSLEAVNGINAVSVSQSKNQVELDMSKDIPLSVVNDALRRIGTYQLTAIEPDHIAADISTSSLFVVRLRQYYPLLLIFSYIIFGVIIGQILRGSMTGESIMTDFMGLFFIQFSFFKLLDLPGFVNSYQMYDLPTSRFRPYGYAYPFIELALGMSYLLYSRSIILHLLTFGIMTVSLLGVLISIRNKRQIQCACLGTLFKLPMGKVTIIEDSLMIIMAVLMTIEFIVH